MSSEELCTPFNLVLFTRCNINSIVRVLGLVLLDFSFEQCVSFETSTTNHFLSENPGCWRTLFMAYLDAGIFGKGWDITDYMTKNTRLIDA